MKPIFSGLLVLLFIVATNLNGQSGEKFNKIQTTADACSCMQLINEYLMKQYSDDDFKNTGISAFVAYNNVAVMSGAFNKNIDLDTLFYNIFLILQNQNIDYTNIQYLIFANNTNDLISSLGYAIAVSGQDFKNKIQDFDQLKASAIRLKDKEIYESDPELSKIIKHFRMLLANSKTYGSPVGNTSLFWNGNREKIYSSAINQCLRSVRK